jgi:heat shock protein HtpX
MKTAKRIFLFLLLNFLVVAMISIVTSIFNIRPYLSSFGLDYQSLMVWCFLWGIGGALLSLSLSRVMAKWMVGVKLIDPNSRVPEEMKLLEMVRSLSKQAGMNAMPQVGIFPSNEPNAFATGPTQKRSLVAVSTGLLNRMSSDELKGVLGHEIAHIANGDMVTMTLLQGVVNAFVMFLARVLAAIISGFGKNRDSGQKGSYGSFMLLTILFEVVFMLLGSIVIFAYSRYREFRADAGGAKLAGKSNMIQALKSLQSYKQAPDPRTEQSAIAAFKISRPSKKGLRQLFSSHPPLEERIERLEKGSY